MAAAYEEFHARLEELERTVNFTAASASLRPRLGDALKWEVGGEAIQLAVSFMSAKVTVEDIYAALLVRAVASFEHFARVLVEEAARHTAASGKSYAELGEHVNVRHTVLTGRLLSALEELPEYQTIDVEQIVNNLASCISGRSGFRLNTSAFSAVVTSPKPGVIQFRPQLGRRPQFADPQRQPQRAPALLR